ncbi:MAG: hypothetical protein U9O64_04380 [Campylobacterota bacterium]|nr:hypothetical protein [Campylobacterota bacterium]
MTTFQRYTLIFLLFFSNLNAYDLLMYHDANLTCQVDDSEALILPKKREGLESRYDKLERKLSEYKGSWFKDMMTYSADILIPDEMTKALKDVLHNRQKEGFGEQNEQIPKIVANDSYNVLLTTAYYYMQDISRITERVWKHEACNPDSFTYDKSKEPQTLYLALQECDSIARGVTEDGIVIPYNANFPTAFYPYAKQPDGCSAEGLQDLYEQANDISDDDAWLRKACNRHDACYYTLGTTSLACNSQFIIEVIDACNHIRASDTLYSLGVKNAFCGFKGLSVATGANACARRYFAHAQKKQKAYMQWIERYLQAYKNAKKQLQHKKGQ